jgi:hypothetical protein
LEGAHSECRFALFTRTHFDSATSMPSKVHQSDLTVLVWSPEGAVLGSPAPSGRSFAGLILKA